MRSKPPAVLPLNFLRIKMTDKIWRSGLTIIKHNIYKWVKPSMPNQLGYHVNQITVSLHTQLLTFLMLMLVHSDLSTGFFHLGTSKLYLNRSSWQQIRLVHNLFGSIKLILYYQHSKNINLTIHLQKTLHQKNVFSSIKIGAYDHKISFVNLTLTEETQRDNQMLVRNTTQTKVTLIFFCLFLLSADTVHFTTLYIHF